MNVRDRVDALRTKSPDELRGMAPQNEELDVYIDGKKQTVITWHDVPEPGQHRFVVAAYSPAYLGLASRISAMGFLLLADGSTRDLTDRELSRFQ